MEDIPLNVQQQQQQEQKQPTSTESQLAGQVASTTATDSMRGKSSSLKRFFKLGKKAGTQSESAIQLETRVAADGVAAAASGVDGTSLESALEGKDLRGSTRRRFHLRLRTPNKATDANEHESKESASPPPPPPPPPNLKPTLKSSISSYWHSLFKRHQDSSPSVNKVQEQANVTAAVADGIAQAVTSTADAAELGEAGAVCSAPLPGDKAHNMPAGIEEVQVLALSEEVEEDQQELATAAN